MNKNKLVLYYVFLIGCILINMVGFPYVASKWSEQDDVNNPSIIASVVKYNSLDTHIKNPIVIVLGGVVMVTLMMYMFSFTCDIVKNLN